MNQVKSVSQITDDSEFTRIDPNLIKIESGELWRDVTLTELEALKSSIAWRERRMKGSGVLVPLLVTRMEGVPYYKLEDGYRRLRAIQSLISEGLPFESVPVRILASPLSISERLLFLTQSSKPLDPLEEGRVLVRLEKQGLSLERLSELMSNRPIDTLKKRLMIAKMTGPIAHALKSRAILPEDIEIRLDPNEPLEAQQQALEKDFSQVLSELSLPKFASPPGRLGKSLGRKDSRVIPNHKTGWIPKILDPALHYLSMEGLYEWMGGEQAAKNGYSKKIVEIIKLILKYCGGAISLPEVAQKLKKY